MERRKHGLLFVGGNAPDPLWYEHLKNRFDLIVAADQGFDIACRLGIQVDRVVGDMDSVGNTEAFRLIGEDKLIRYDEDKDYTDTEIGLDLLWEMGCADVCIYGGGGGRLDHLVALLSLFERDTYPDVWVTDTHLVVTVSDDIEIVGKMGNVVSFFPVGKKPCTMTSSGLKWPLDGLVWKKGDCGVSNVISEESMRVQVKTGRLVMIGELVLLDEVMR